MPEFPHLVDLKALAAHSRLRVRSAEDLGACLVGESGGLRLLFRVAEPQAMAALLGEMRAEKTTLEVQEFPVLRLGESRLLPPLLPGEHWVEAVVLPAQLAALLERPEILSVEPSMVTAHERSQLRDGHEL